MLTKNLVGFTSLLFSPFLLANSISLTYTGSHAKAVYSIYSYAGEGLGYCQKDFGQLLGQKTASASDNKWSYDFVFTDLYCLKVESYATHAQINPETTSFGPLLAQCGENQTLTLTTGNFSWVSPIPASCIPQDRARVKFKSERLVNPPSEYSIHLFKKGSSKFCNANSGRGEIIYSTLLTNLTTQTFERVMGMKPDDAFCAAIVPAAENPSKGYYLAGPFILPQSNIQNDITCELLFDRNKDIFGAYNLNCSDEHTVVSFKNEATPVNPEEPKPIKVEVLNAGLSQDCSKGSDRGREIGGFNFYPNQYQSLLLDDIEVSPSTSNKEICLVISGDELENSPLRVGPFVVGNNEGKSTTCTISIDNHNVHTNGRCDHKR